MNYKILYWIGIGVIVIACIMMLVSKSIYPPTIQDKYQQCNMCIKENNVQELCNCEEIVKTLDTTPAGYISTTIIIVVIGLICMLLDWIHRYD